MAVSANSLHDQRTFAFATLLLFMPAAHDVRPSSIMGYEANLHPRRQPVATVKPSHDGWSENERLAISSRNEASPSKDRPKRSRCACADTCSSGQGLIVRGLTKVAQRLEAVQIPKRRLACGNQLITKYGTSQLNSSSQQASGEEPSELPEVIPLISGLTPVISGAAPAADTVRILTVKPPRYIFYSISGFLCDIVQLFIDLAVHFALSVDDPSTCWAIGFGLSIVVRHSSHRYFTFGAYVGGYWRSLGRMYMGYSVSIALSTAFNVVMARMGMPHYVAFGFTLLWTGVVNYFILKRLWSFGVSGVDDKGGKLEKADSSV